MIFIILAGKPLVNVRPASAGFCFSDRDGILSKICFYFLSLETYLLKGAVHLRGRYTGIIIFWSKKEDDLCFFLNL